MGMFEFDQKMKASVGCGWVRGGKEIAANFPLPLFLAKGRSAPGIPWAASAMLQNKPACDVYFRRTPTRLAVGGKCFVRVRGVYRIGVTSENSLVFGLWERVFGASAIIDLQ